MDGAVFQKGSTPLRVADLIGARYQQRLACCNDGPHGGGIVQRLEQRRVMCDWPPFMSQVILSVMAVGLMRAS